MGSPINEVVGMDHHCLSFPGDNGTAVDVQSRVRTTSVELAPI